MKAGPFSARDSAPEQPYTAHFWPVATKSYKPAPSGFSMSLCLSVLTVHMQRPLNSWIDFHKIVIEELNYNLSTYSNLLKPEKYNGHLTWRTMRVSGFISNSIFIWAKIVSSENVEKCNLKHQKALAVLIKVSWLKYFAVTVSMVKKLVWW